MFAYEFLLKQVHFKRELFGFRPISTTMHQAKLLYNQNNNYPQARA